MKKTTKRLISILLSLLLLVSVGALSILAADVEVDEENVAEYGSDCEVSGEAHTKDNESMIVLRDFSCVEDIKTVYGVEKNYVLYYCNDCGMSIRLVLDKPTGVHTPKVVAGTPATCYAEGKEEGSVCSVCGKVLAEQKVIGKIEHVDENGDGWCDVEACKYEMQEHCRFCGQLHPDNFIGKITVFFHNLFANLGLKK